MKAIETILWRGLAFPGYESCGLFSQDSKWRLQGTAVFSNEGHPCRLSYHIVCDESWQTESARVEGWLNNDFVDLQITTEHGRWRLNDAEQPEVAGCSDIDLNFSPSTNLLPIRRLGLGVGGEAEVKAAWLRFPSFQLEPLTQVYSRLDEHIYRYESGGGQFMAELKVNPSGFVLDYPGIWQAEAVST